MPHVGRYITNQKSLKNNRPPPKITNRMTLKRTNRITLKRPKGMSLKRLKEMRPHILSTKILMIYKEKEGAGMH